MAPAKDSAPTSSRYSNLKKSFRLGARSVLTAFSKEDVYNAFSTFTDAEKERLYGMFIQVIKSLHGNIEEEFDSVCQETQVGTVLDLIEQLVEEHNLDVLSADGTNVADVKERISKAKQDEINHLTNLLEKAEEQNRIMTARTAYLKEKLEELTVNADAIERVRSWTANLGRSS